MRHSDGQRDAASRCCPLEATCPIAAQAAPPDFTAEFLGTNLGSEAEQPGRAENRRVALKGPTHTDQAAADIPRRHVGLELGFPALLGCHLVGILFPLGKDTWV